MNLHYSIVTFFLLLNCYMSKFDTSSSPDISFGRSVFLKLINFLFFFVSNAICEKIGLTVALYFSNFSFAGSFIGNFLSSDKLMYFYVLPANLSFIRF